MSRLSTLNRYGIGCACLDEVENYNKTLDGYIALSLI
jgi:hypothetical protein